MKIEAIVTTNPAGYEEVFNDLFSYSVDDESIAEVNEDGIITGVSKGTTSVIIKNGEKAQTIDVTVTDLQLLNIFSFNTCYMYYGYFLLFYLHFCI